MKVKCVIIDDEPLAINVIENHLKNFDHVEIVSTFTNPLKAYGVLEQEKVEVRTVKEKLCHAKAYIFDANTEKGFENFFVTGSSNFTYSGLKIDINSSYANIELNQADTGLNSDYEILQNWYSNLWENDTTENITDENEDIISCKQFLINRINNFFKTYTPLELYYKVLFELFKDEFKDIDKNSIFIENIEHLKETIVYNKLYKFQEKGVLSLIRMLQLHNGAILADAVGLGKTWQALSVLKYFELQGYETLVLAPKKLNHNWSRYRLTEDNLFKKDKLRYFVRNHTDLQINMDGSHRLNNPNKYSDFPLSTFQRNAKILIVIDESHNLRNDKSNRYNYLVEYILTQNKDVKVLLLSATPINNYITDIRNQFKLLVRGDDSGFADTKFEISNLQDLFKIAQEKINIWKDLPNRNIGQLTSQLPQDFFELTDDLIVARTRKLIEDQQVKNENGEIVKFDFPKKEAPVNLFVEITNIGKLKTFNKILDLMQVNLTAYKPAYYIQQEKPKSVLQDEKLRQGFLAKMMYILMVKRMESSWFSFKSTVENILLHHINALTKIKNFLSGNEDSYSDILKDIEENTDDYNEGNEDFNILKYFEENGKAIEKPIGTTLGNKNPIDLSQIIKPEVFIEHLEKDIEMLKELSKNLDTYAKSIEKENSNTKSNDKKLEKLMNYISEKQETKNKKIVVFTVFADTANYLFNELTKRKFANLALITGQVHKCEYNIEPKQGFEPVLQRFAPYTKLFKEQDWSDLYTKNKLPKPKTFNQWKKIIKEHDIKTLKKINEPIDILISTDVLSEGQNLQDADTVINYDVHWNPVRLIQRFGRIDRLGSPNKTVRAVNFWPAKSIDDYLNLKNRVEDRLALMTVVGAEIVELDDALKERIKNNPLISKQTEKMLKQMDTSWDDIETNKTSFGMNNLSLEEYRQDLYDYLQSQRKELEAIPNGVFSGFKLINKLRTDYNSGIIALIGNPRKPQSAGRNYSYAKKELIYIDKKGEKFIINNVDALNFLKQNKNQKRYVPVNIEKGNEETLNTYIDLIKKWMDKRTGKQAEQNIISLLQGASAKKVKKSKKEKYLEDLYDSDNWDLITWFVVSK